VAASVDFTQKEVLKKFLIDSSPGNIKTYDDLMESSGAMNMQLLMAFKPKKPPLDSETIRKFLRDAKISRIDKAKMKPSRRKHVGKANKLSKSTG
jgi:hypothetical protein